MKFFANLVSAFIFASIAHAQSPAELLGPAAGPPVDPNEVIVKVNGTPIYERQVIAEADSRINADNARDAAMGLIFEESRRQAARDFIRKDVLHTLIERELIAQRLKADKIEISDAEVNERLLDQAKTHEPETVRMLRDAEEEISKRGMTLKSVRDRLRWNTIGVEKLYDAHAKDKKAMTEAEALHEYQQYPAEFDVEEQRRVSHILINATSEGSAEHKKAAKEKAVALLKKIRAGGDFQKLAAAESEDLTSKAKGGDRGWSKRGYITSPTDDPFGNVAFAMKKVGDISDVVETRDGFHIIKLTGIREARRKSFDEAKKEMMAKYRYLEIGRFWEEFGAELWAKGKIETSPAELARQAETEKRQQEFNRKIEEMITREREKQEKEVGELSKTNVSALLQSAKQ